MIQEEFCKRIYFWLLTCENVQAAPGKAPGPGWQGQAGAVVDGGGLPHRPLQCAHGRICRPSFEAANDQITLQLPYVTQQATPVQL